MIKNSNEIIEFIKSNISTMNLRDIAVCCGTSPTVISNYIKKENIDLPKEYNRNRVIDEDIFRAVDDLTLIFLGSVWYNGNIYEGKKSPYFQFFIPKENKDHLLLLRDLFSIKSKVLEIGNAYSYSITSLLVNELLISAGFPDIPKIEESSRVKFLAGIYSTNKYSSYTFTISSKKKLEAFMRVFKNYVYFTGKQLIIKEEYRLELDTYLESIRNKVTV